MQGEPDESAELEDAPDPEGIVDADEPTEADADVDESTAEADEADDKSDGDEDEADDDEAEPDETDEPEAQADDEADELDELEADLPDDLIDDDPEPDAELAADLAEEPEPDSDADADPDEATALAYEPWAPPRRRHRWIARIVVPLIVVIPAVVIVSVIRDATTSEDESVDARLIDKLRYDGEGNPVILAPLAKLGTTQSREWRVCGAECDRISGRGSDFRPGEVLAGSRVEVKIVAERGEANIVTPGWDGQLRLLDRPTLTGSPVIGSVVTANPGRWTGGWIGGQPLLGIRACPTQAGGAKCVAFTSSILDDTHKPTRTIPESFRGWWLGAIEWQIPPGRDLDPAQPDPERPTAARPAPLRSIAVATGPLQGPIG